MNAEQLFPGFSTARVAASGTTINLVHGGAGPRIACPLLVLWSRSGIGSAHDVLEVWLQQAADVRGRALDCGHLLAEERPEEVVTELRKFLKSG